jgi:hypothetical protein
MRCAILNVFLASLLALMPLAASALENEAAYNDVVTSLEGGTTAGDIIRALVKDYDMTLAEATVFAMVAGGQANRVAFATAGIESAGNLAQAQSVANAVKAAAGDTGAVATAVDQAIAKYAELMPQPNVYEDEYSPTGGAISPAA